MHPPYDCENCGKTHFSCHYITSIEKSGDSVIWYLANVIIRLESKIDRLENELKKLRNPND